MKKTTRTTPQLLPSSRPQVPTVQTVTPLPSIPTESVPALSPLNETAIEKFEKEMEMTFNEFINSADFSDVSQVLLSLNHNLHSRVVEKLVSLSFEKKDTDRKLIVELFHYLHKEHILIQDDFVQGFLQILQFMDDLAIDIPFAPKFVGVLIKEGVKEGWMVKSAIEPALNRLNSKTKSKILAEINSE